MSKLIGIVGYKNSGKTTLVARLARALLGRGYRVAVVKHTHHPIDLPGKDTAVLREAAGQVALLSPTGAAIFWEETKSLQEITRYLDAQVVLVEGLKAEHIPKIACLRGRPDDRELLDEWVIAVVGPTEWISEVNVPHYDREDIEALAALVEVTVTFGSDRHR
ncbi:MAG: molybdopterin-guanine dinucleotide biosynthesis protein B [Anaerolineae bacterium]|nr:molybdopterin-guanine dinucleotide biosynthesis protein B [Anaerolineae bacterium]